MAKVTKKSKIEKPVAKEEKPAKVEKPVKQEKKVEKVEKEEKKTFKSKYWYGLGRRKTAIAKVRLYSDHGGFEINEQDASEYFPTPVEVERALYPLKLTGNNKFGLKVRVNGGGKVAQADAVRLGVARALVVMDKDLKTTLKRSGLLTRDPREKERKKYGLKGARRAPQWAKR